MDYEQIESSQRQHNEVMRHQGAMHTVMETEEYNLFSMLKPKICKDGDQWCCLYGENLQVGITGFGDTPYKAILDWNSNWHKQ